MEGRSGFQGRSGVPVLFFSTKVVRFDGGRRWTVWSRPDDGGGRHSGLSLGARGSCEIDCEMKMSE